ncbi:hypothetical protein HUU53_04340 [Candidatus Micrarchaeota archaeon]|nr:hypothetical protein [Candidatus Micrarchaeota archaeon]
MIPEELEAFVVNHGFRREIVHKRDYPNEYRQRLKNEITYLKQLKFGKNKMFLDCLAVRLDKLGENEADSFLKKLKPLAISNGFYPTLQPVYVYPSSEKDLDKGHYLLLFRKTVLVKK